MRAVDQPLQREALRLPMVLVRLSCRRHRYQLPQLAVPIALLARTRAVRSQADPGDGRDAARGGHPGQVRRELPASRRDVHRATDRHEHGRGGRRRGAVRTVEQLQPREADNRREARSEADRKESRQWWPYGSGMIGD